MTTWMLTVYSFNACVRKHAKLLPMTEANALPLCHQRCSPRDHFLEKLHVHIIPSVHSVLLPDLQHITTSTAQQWHVARPNSMQLHITTLLILYHQCHPRWAEQQQLNQWDSHCTYMSQWRWHPCTNVLMRLTLHLHESVAVTSVHKRSNETHIAPTWVSGGDVRAQTF